MIITCPHCQTKYQVTYDAIGSAGRKVQCAQCSRAWQQPPLQTAVASPAERAEDDRLFDTMAEDALDEVLLSEEKQVQAERAIGRSETDAPRPPAEAPPTDPVELKRRQQAFSRRQNEMASRLPLARLRRTARIVAALILIALPAIAYLGRVQLVERYPSLAGLYAAVGLGVNVVGLDFSNLQSLKTTSGGQESLSVSAQIVGLAGRPVRVPPVIISLLGADGATVYEWSVASRIPDLMAGERATFETRLTLPPTEAVRVRLSFAGSAAQTSASPAAATSTETAPSPAPAPASAEPAPPPAEPAHGAAAEHH